MPAANGQIAIDSYTVTYGRTEVAVMRDRTGWRIVSQGGAGYGPLYSEADHDAMMETAVEYAKRLDAAREMLRKAQKDVELVHDWLEGQVYVAEAAEQGGHEAQ